MLYDICIVGAGVTGLSLLLLLKEAGHDLKRVCIIDPYFDGGDLARRWGGVTSNTPWSKTSDALKRVGVAGAGTSRHDPAATTPLFEIAEAVRAEAGGLLRLVGRQIQGEATRAEYSVADKVWSVWVGGAHVKARALLLVPGAEPRTLDLPIARIPLEIALDRGQLSRYVKPRQKVLVFGTMHSGTLVMRNLVDCSANVVGLYNTDAPFYWDRDGAYDGIKMEAADVADAIVAGRIPVELVQTQRDTSALIRASMEADWVVYAMGFRPRLIPLKVDGVEKSAGVYDGLTGALTEVPCAWGFGIAYPNRAPDGVHWDVSVAAFLDHMKPQMPAILAALEGAAGSQ
jgi:hypothetical protein